MGLRLESLNDDVRKFMLREVEFDVGNGSLYRSKHFNDTGNSVYLDLIKQTVQHYDDDWLAERIRVGSCMNRTAMRRKPKGGFTEVKVPVTAPDTFAEGEFNRFYARGLCLHAIEIGVPALLVYRAKAVMVPRADSEAMIGSMIDAKALLADLRIHQGVDTALGLPNGPNSGLSVRLPE
jgi:hypothetical protein